MWTVALNGGLTGLVGRLGLRVGGHLALGLHSSNEPDELSQWSRHDDNTINIVTGIIIIVLKLAIKSRHFHCIVVQKLQFSCTQCGTDTLRKSMSFRR